MKAVTGLWPLAVVIGTLGAACFSAPSSTVCPANQVDCNGTCVDTHADPSNCGSCGNACAVACNAGSCVTSCPQGTSNCSGTCTDTTSDPAHCGSCTSACSTGKVCQSGQCACGASASFSSQVQPIFTSTCAVAGCHSGIKPQQGLNLESGKAYANIVNVPSSAAGCSGRIRVVPGAADQSYLVDKLLGTNLCAGTQMPKTGATIPAAQLDAIEAWICNGAQNN